MSDPRITRRRFIQDLGVGAASLAVLPRLAACAAPDARRPNILYIMCDDLAYQAISAYGSGLDFTPSIDRLAEEGVRFTRSFVTNSICGPSRAVLLTGKYSHVNGFKDNFSSFDGAQETFPKILQRAGYATAVFGKWHLESDPTGFDYWNILPGQGDYYNPDFIEMGRTVRRHGYVTDLITDDCLDWLANRDLDKPFCALLHHKAITFAADDQKRIPSDEGIACQTLPAFHAFEQEHPAFTVGDAQEGCSRSQKIAQDVLVHGDHAPLMSQPCQFLQRRTNHVPPL